MSLFATPESVAAAMSYVSAQLSLLSDFTDHARKARSGEPLAIVNLRRSIEGDRFGLVAQVLTARDGCIPNDCLALASLHSRISNNLAGGTFDFFVTLHVAGWPTGGTRPPSAALVASSPGTAPAGPTLAGTSTESTRTANRTRPDECFFLRRHQFRPSAS